MNLVKAFSDIFWHKSIWLPPNLTSWEQVDPKFEYQFTDHRHLYQYAIPLAFVMLFIQCLTETQVPTIFYLYPMGTQTDLFQLRFAVIVAVKL